MPDKVQNQRKSIKHAIIDKTNKNMLIAVAVATFVFMFSLFAAKALISQSLYHGRIISEKESALDQLKENKASLEELEKSFTAFKSEPVNILGGSSTGEGPLDGDNAVIVLAALPSGYDYPALSSSFEKILRNGGYDIGSIGGTEDSSLASNNIASGIATPIEIPYSFTVSSNSAGTSRLLDTLESSIRPMYVDSLRIQIGENILQSTINLHTYFTQPKTFQLGAKEIK